MDFASPLWPFQDKALRELEDTGTRTSIGRAFAYGMKEN